MFKKILVPLLIIFPVFFLASFVSWKWLILSWWIDAKGIISEHVYLDDTDLNQTVVYYESENDLSSMQLVSPCNVSSKYVSSNAGRYYFHLKYLDKECKNANILLKKDNVALEDSMISVKFFDKADFFSTVTDYSDDKLGLIQDKLNKQAQKYKIFSKYNSDDKIDHFDFLQKNRIYKESVYQLDIVLSIMDGRERKYLIPVPGYEIPTKLTKIPNAARPYREKYTDGIHHSWDIDTPFWEKVVALDDGVIMRVVNDWDWSDFSKLRYSEDMTHEDELRNFDIYRGNQVWLKTRKGDVIFYNHLNEVYTHFEEWDIVTAGTLLGTVGVSWVPEKWYDDYHLDFSIQKNPYNSDMAWNYDIVDYMSWDWEFKWKSAEYILENQSQIFEG